MELAGGTLHRMELTDASAQPTVQDDATLFGLNSAGTAIPIMSSASTSMLVLHIVSAVVTTVCVLSLILPPSYLGSPTSTLYMLQKSGLATVGLGLAAFILTFVTFASRLCPRQLAVPSLML